MIEFDLFVWNKNGEDSGRAAEARGARPPVLRTPRRAELVTPRAGIAKLAARWRATVAFGLLDAFRLLDAPGRPAVCGARGA